MLSKTKPYITKYAWLILLYAFGPFFFALTDPGRLPIALLIVPFMWLFIALFVTTWLVLKREGQAKRRRSIIATAAATLPVLLLVFQSIHQLSIKDVLLAVVLLVAITFYLSKADFI